MSILQRILDRKRADVEERRRAHPVPRMVPPAYGPTRSLAAALSRPGLRFILEVKQRSPSEGVLRDAFDPVDIALAYSQVADAISVLADGPYFHGSLDHLRRVREQVSLPVLCKDFVIDPYQIAEARAAGADAILLMLSVLDDARYRECAGLAARLGMETLTEVHSQVEVSRAIRLGARIIGINNRDLATLSVDLETTRRLGRLIPDDRLVVSESGIRTRTDVDQLAPDASAFLVGSGLMQAPHVGRAARQLIYGRVKVCGLTRAVDARAAWRHGATLGGLIFAPESPRAVNDVQAATIIGAAALSWVGVFVNDQVERIDGLARKLGLSAVQLHGEETLDFVHQLRGLLPAGCEIWKAVRVEDRMVPLEETGADRLLLDGYHREQRGGTGRRFDWGLLLSIPDRSHIVLSGGLSPENIRRAHDIGCGVLDVNSGVESAPGIKDPERLRSLFASLRSAS